MKLKEVSVLNNKRRNPLTQKMMNETRWSKKAKQQETWKEYPRPTMMRKNWFNLNGWWDYKFTSDKEINIPDTFDGKILVPFSPESELSGVKKQLQPSELLWYQRRINLNELEISHNACDTLPNKISENCHLLLHFGAVDQQCSVYVNDKCVGKHNGGYLPFTIELDYLESFTLTVCVKDESDTSFHGRGKQKLNRGGMFYTAQSGIWQTVWMEIVPEKYIKSVQFDTDDNEVKVRIETNQSIIKKTIHIENPHLWSLEDPYLYYINVKRGTDQVQCYFAMRKISIGYSEDGHPRFFLNGKPVIQTGVLDQGYWCDGLYTAPSDEALIYDIQTMKDLGFNVLRKHIKIEPERWYYHCDRLGMLVWQDMINGGSSYKHWFITYTATAMNMHHIHFSDGPLSRMLLSRISEEGQKEYLEELEETIKHLKNHPSIIVWVPFNEGWGQFEANLVTERIRKLDPTRLIDQASGWFDQKGGDMVSLHYYFFKLKFKPETNRVLVLSEFGGYTWQVPGHTYTKKLYGYGGFNDKESLSKAFASLYEDKIIENIPKGISGFIYTQLSDVEDEANGLLTYDREIIKIDKEIIQSVNKKIKEIIK